MKKRETQTIDPKIIPTAIALVICSIALGVLFSWLSGYWTTGLVIGVTELICGALWLWLYLLDKMSEGNLILIGLCGVILLCGEVMFSVLFNPQTLSSRTYPIEKINKHDPHQFVFYDGTGQLKEMDLGLKSISNTGVKKGDKDQFMTVKVEKYRTGWGMLLGSDERFILYINNGKTANDVVNKELGTKYVHVQEYGL